MVQNVIPNTVTYSDIDISFEANPATGDILRKSGDFAVIQSLKNLVRSNFYDRPFHPNLGGSVTQFLFENPDPLVLESIRTSIEEVINNFEPRVNLVEVSVVSNPYSRRIEASMTFFIINNTEPTNISVFLTRVR